jgi:hypothetical protein
LFALGAIFVEPIFATLTIQAAWKNFALGDANHCFKVCAFLSFADNSASVADTGHLIPISGSFHRIPDSPLLL